MWAGHLARIARLQEKVDQDGRTKKGGGGRQVEGEGCRQGEVKREITAGAVATHPQTCPPVFWTGKMRKVRFWTGNDLSWTGWTG